jgi:hypothetical protein
LRIHLDTSSALLYLKRCPMKLYTKPQVVWWELSQQSRVRNREAKPMLVEKRSLLL